MSKLQGIALATTLTQNQEHDYLQVSLTRGSFQEPAVANDATKPLAILALGAAIGGVIPILEEREIMKKNNRTLSTLKLLILLEQLGPLYLYYGCRQSTKDFLLKDKIQKYVSTGLITQLFTTFSHDQPERIYTDHKLRENPGLIWKVLQTGHFHYIGYLRYFILVSP